MGSLFSKTINQPEIDTPREMTFLEHLEELRWHLVKAAIGVILSTILCAVYVDYIVHEILMRPLLSAGLKAQVLTPYGIVLLYMQTVLICGFIISMPNTLFWIWKFVAPGLLSKERKYIFLIVMLTSLCFFGGVAFSYFIMLPTALAFFSVFGTSTIDLNISIDHYVSFVLTLMIGAGLVFELPMASYFLSKMGILTPAFLKHYRRHAIVAILVVAAIVTPTPDPISQVLLAVPLLLLFELSVVISRIVQRNKNRLEEES